MASGRLDAGRLAGPAITPATDAGAGGEHGDNPGDQPPADAVQDGDDDARLLAGITGDTFGDTIFALIGTKNVSPDFTKPYFYRVLATRRRCSGRRGRWFKSSRPDFF